MLQRAKTYGKLYRDFAWRIPERFNIGTEIADRWAKAEPDRLAVIERRSDGHIERRSFGQLADASDRLASALRQRGLRRGDRIALLLPQGFETVVAHAASAKLGTVAVPLALLFGRDALSHRLRTSGARALVANAKGFAKVRAIQEDLPELDQVLVTDGAEAGAADFWQSIADVPKDFEPADTGPDDPALMIFTSGTTGQPKGALHGHRVLLGHLPGIAMMQEFMPQPDDLFWTPADWAWAGGLLNMLLPSLYLGVPVVAAPSEGFDPEAALGLMEALQIRNAFIPPTALRLLRGVPDIQKRFRLNLRAVSSAGEALGRETFERAEEALGLPVNEAYGQTECNLVIASCAALGVSRPGATGLPVPGHEVAVIDGDGRELPPGEAGEIAVRRPDPVMFLRYWENEEATAEKFRGDWMLTGDQAFRDADGYFYFKGRNDDIITSAGFRIGPGEVEDCLNAHPAVRMSAAVGKPDAIRTEIVKAYVALNDGFAASPELADGIRAFVRERLSAHEYPREVEFVDAVPLTTSGKVIRRAFRERARAEAEG
ncbi:MAG TPA: AMP-binding protein [Mesorhizobium sp.]|jgi:acetyl-CoA synthetase|nr:AMP-binding protein [Mesorhizobium sp.]